MQGGGVPTRGGQGKHPYFVNTRKNLCVPVLARNKLGTTLEISVLLCAFMRQPFMLDEVVKNTEVVYDVVLRSIEHFSGQFFVKLKPFFFYISKSFFYISKSVFYLSRSFRHLLKTTSSVLMTS